MQRFTPIEASVNGVLATWHGNGEVDAFGVYTRLLSGPRTMSANSSIAGIVFDDANFNGIRDSLIVGTAPDVVYVIDVSGSISNSFRRRFGR